MPHAEPPSLPDAATTTIPSASKFLIAVSILVAVLSKPILIFGASNDKSLAHLSAIDDVIDAWYFCEFTNQRSYRGDQLKQVIDELKLKKTQQFNQVNQAIQAALETRKENQAILVTGSFFLLSDCQEIQAIIGNQLTQ